MTGSSQQSRRSWSPDEPFDIAIHPKNDSSLSSRVRHGAATSGDKPDLPDLEAFIGSNDAEDSPWNQPLARLPPQLRDSSAIDALVRLSGKSLNDENLRDGTLSPALQDLLRVSVAFPQELFELLFVWLYNYGPTAQRVLALCQKADDGRITIALLVQARSSLLSPPSWLAVVLQHGAGCPSGRWINEVSLTWVDTTWRTAFSVLHVGSVSPLAMMPRIEPFRMKSLWAMHLLQTRANIRRVTEVSDLAAPTDDAIRTHQAEKRAASGKPSTDESRANKKQRQGTRQSRGVGSGKNSNKSTPERNGPRRAGKQKAKVTGPKELPYACHFYKRFPLKHLRCLFHHQKAPRYVKTHLDRCHRLPIHCSACWETFDTQDECDDHAPDQCTSIGLCPFTGADGMTNEQAEQLETLAPGDGATKWYEMWNVLFPDEPEPDSPYIDPEDTETMAATSVHDDRESTYRQSLEELQRQGGLTAVQVQEVMRLFTQTLTSRSDGSTASNSFYEPLDPLFQLAGQPPMQETDFIFTPLNDSQDAQSHSPIPQRLRHQHYHHAEAHASRNVFPFQPSQQQLAPTATYHGHAQHQPHRQQQFHVGHNGFFYQQAGSYAQGDPAMVAPQLHQQHQHDILWPGETIQSTHHHRPMLVPTVSQASNSTSRRSKPPPAQGEGGSSASMSHEAPSSGYTPSPSSSVPPVAFGFHHEDQWAQFEDYLRTTLQAAAGPVQAFSRDEHDRPRVHYPPGSQQQQQQQQHHNQRQPVATGLHQRGGVYNGTAPLGDVFYHADSGLPYDPSTYPAAQTAPWTCPG